MVYFSLIDRQKMLSVSWNPGLYELFSLQPDEQWSLPVTQMSSHMFDTQEVGIQVGPHYAH